MSGEHSTPIGTPVVIAPGKIFLVGEYAVLEEGSAILAAISRYANAQFIPRMASTFKLVSELVKRTKLELGEVSAALPPGCVLVNSDDFHLGVPAGGLGSSAAIAVASVGAVFASLGLAIEKRKPQILNIADAGRRVTQGDVGSGADSAAATYGGLVAIKRIRGNAPQIEPLPAPVGLHLVIFSAGPSISTRQMIEGVQQYAKRNPYGFTHAMDSLREIAQRFRDEVVSGSATGAVFAAGRYGEELAKLSSTAGVSIMTEAFAHAADMAKEFGGIAKPTGAGGGEIGVAMFATPEAAQLFRKACTEPLTLLKGELESLGLRCKSSNNPADHETDPNEFDIAPSTEPDEVALPPIYDLAEVESCADTADTAPTPMTENPVSVPVSVTMPPDSSVSTSTSRRRNSILLVAIAGLVIVVAAFILLSTPIRSGLDDDPLPAHIPANTKPAIATPPTAEMAKSLPAPEPIVEAGEQQAQPVKFPSVQVAKHGRKVVSSRSAQVTSKPTDSPAAVSQETAAAQQPSTPVSDPEPAKTKNTRAGTLSSDDF
jgi:phosphomevalonate kinase